METIACYRICDKEYGGESKWCRTEMKGNTIDLMYFIFAVPLNDKESFESELAKKIKYFLCSQEEEDGCDRTVGFELRP